VSLHLLNEGHSSGQLTQHPGSRPQSPRSWLLGVRLWEELKQLRPSKQIFVREGDWFQDESGRNGVHASRFDERSRTLAEWHRILKRTFSSRRSTRWIFPALRDKKARHLPELANGLERALERGRYKIGVAIWQVPDKRRAGRALCAALERCPLRFLPRVAPFAAFVAIPGTRGVAAARFAEAVRRYGYESRHQGSRAVLAAAGAVLMTEPTSRDAAQVLAAALVTSNQAIQQEAARALQWCWRVPHRRPRGEAARALEPALRYVLKDGNEDLFSMLVDLLRSLDKRAVEIRIARILRRGLEAREVFAACWLLELRTSTGTKAVKAWVQRTASIEDAMLLIYSSRVARKLPGLLWPTLERAVENPSPYVRFLAAEILCGLPGVRAAKLAQRTAQDEPDPRIRHLFLRRAATGARGYKTS